MAGDGGTADRKLIGDLLHGTTAAAEDLHDRPPVGVAQRVEGLLMQWLGHGQCAGSLP
jgi:hypothetical protein